MFVLVFSNSGIVDFTFCSIQMMFCKQPCASSPFWGYYHCCSFVSWHHIYSLSVLQLKKHFESFCRIVFHIGLAIHYNTHYWRYILFAEIRSRSSLGSFNVRKASLRLFIRQIRQIRQILSDINVPQTDILTYQIW